MEVTNKCGEVEPQPMEMTNSGMAPMSGHALPAPPHTAPKRRLYGVLTEFISIEITKKQLKKK